MASAPDLLVWIDCEMTGLDLDRDELVEVAVVVTDYDLVAVDPGFEIVIRPRAAAPTGMGACAAAVQDRRVPRSQPISMCPASIRPGGWIWTVKG